jgi:hypothetical protein
MSTAPPIACSLSAGALSARLAEIAELGRAALLGVHSEQLRAELTFASGDGVRARIQAIAVAESQCCAFLTMRVSDVAETVVLSIEAPQRAEFVLAEIVGAFSRPAPGGVMSTSNQPRRGSDVALIGGGLLMALCCAVGPAVIGAVAGSAIGGWLGIACAILLAAALGLVLHRHTSRRGAC